MSSRLDSLKSLYRVTEHKKPRYQLYIPGVSARGTSYRNPYDKEKHRWVWMMWEMGKSKCV